VTNPRHPIKKAVRERVKAKYEGRCGYCGCAPDKIHIDHIHPVAKGHHLESYKDLNRFENLMPSCHSCNNFKMSFTLEEFRRELQAQVQRARQYSVNFRLAERYRQIQVTETPIKFYFETVAP
jgi:5-methylcytosine-specific restriction endonuclease McrA